MLSLPCQPLRWVLHVMGIYALGGQVRRGKRRDRRLQIAQGRGWCKWALGKGQTLHAALRTRLGRGGLQG